MDDKQEVVPTSPSLWDRAQQFSEQLLARGISGVGPFKGAVPVAEEALRTADGVEDAVGRLLRSHVTQAASSGFLTGLGGLAALPVTLPAGVTGLYLLGTRLSAGTAHLRGYDVEADEVRSAIMVSLLGSGGEEALQNAGVEVGKRATAAALRDLPGRVLVEINKKVGHRLLSRLGQRSVINLGKAVPLVGGVVGAGTDGMACQRIGHYAKETFPADGGMRPPRTIYVASERADRG